jgi:hypothetical protein
MGMTATQRAAKLWLVDLAGSERLSRSEATGERMKEAQHINKSLSALGDCVQALCARQEHVPYRNAKLTQVRPRRRMGLVQAGEKWRAREIVRSWQKGNAIAYRHLPLGDVVERGCTPPARGATTGAPHQL